MRRLIVVLTIANTVGLLVVGGFLGWLYVEPERWLSLAPTSEIQSAKDHADNAQAYAVRLAGRVNDLERADETLYRYARGLYAVCAVSRQWGDAYPKEYVFANGIGSGCDWVGIPDERVGKKLGDYPDEINP